MKSHAPILRAAHAIPSVTWSTCSGDSSDFSIAMSPVTEMTARGGLRPYVLVSSIMMLSGRLSSEKRTQRAGRRLLPGKRTEPKCAPAAVVTGSPCRPTR